MDERDHDLVGVYFMAVIIGNVSTHLFFLVKDLIRQIKALCKKKCCKKASKVKEGTIKLNSV